MSLLYCPECGNQCSDQATACPKCAYPISKLNFNQATTTQSKPVEQNNFAGLDEYYREQFEEIQKTNEEYRGRFNWYAFWFSWLWLLTKGAWGWALVILGANVAANFLSSKIARGEAGIIIGILIMIGIAITLGHNATKIYYNVRVKNEQF